MPRWAARVVVAVLVVLLGLMVVAVGRSAKDYGTPAFWAAPDRINYCGRQYHRNAGAVHGTPRYFVYLDRNVPTRWQRIGRTFALRPIYATVMVHPTPGKLCAGDLYIATSGRHKYIGYELSGGP